MERQFSAVGLDDAPRDVEAESQAGDPSPGRVASPAEFLEHPRGVLGAYAGSPVYDLEAHKVLLVESPKGYRLPLRRVFDGVGDQVTQYLPDPGPVRPDLPGDGALDL